MKEFRIFVNNSGGIIVAGIFENNMPLKLVSFGSFVFKEANCYTVQIEEEEMEDELKNYIEFGYEFVNLSEITISRFDPQLN